MLVIKFMDRRELARYTCVAGHVFAWNLFKVAEGKKEVKCFLFFFLKAHDKNIIKIINNEFHFKN
jgi:hypothetical protein